MAAQARPTLRAAIGGNVRELRRGLGLTGAELASAAGLSAGMLSKIEAGSVSASVPTLDALARALNVPIARLFTSEDERRDCSYVPAGEGLRIDRRGTKAGHLYDLLGHSLRGAVTVEPYLITLDADAIDHTGFQHDGLEFIYMLEGQVRYRHGERGYDLGPGDALLFDAGAPHGPEALGARPIRYLSIIVTARAG